MKPLAFALLVLTSCQHDQVAAPTSPAPGPAAAGRASTSPAPGPAVAGLAGAWAGSVELPGQSIQIQIIFDDDRGGTIDIPQQGATHLALSRVTRSGDAVTFELPQVGARFAGTLHRDAIAGTMIQSGQSIPFSIKRHGKDAYAPPAPPATRLSAATGAPLVGDWHGDSGELAITATLAAEAGLVVGTAALGRSCRRPAQIANLTFAPPRVQFEAGGAWFDGELRGAAITGTLHQGGVAKPFALARVERLDRAPAPYTELEVTIASASHVTLAGTLTLPTGVSHARAVVLVTGSGPQDRDECVLGVRPFRQLADHLARHGIASLRYDDRGTASSTGDFQAATAVDFTDDAEAALRLLRARPEIDPARVGVIGHSEGGVVAPMLAVRTRDVAFIVLWAGPGLTMPEVDLQQTADMMRAEGAAPAAVATKVDRERRILAALRAAGTEAAFRTALHAIDSDDAWVAAKVKENWSPWLRWYLDYDPAATLASVRCPVLAINGAMDTQVAAGPNLAAIRRALEAGHNAAFEIVELPGVNHLFQPTRTGAPSAYMTDPPVVDPSVLDTTTRWIARHVR